MYSFNMSKNMYDILCAETRYERMSSDQVTKWKLLLVEIKVLEKQSDQMTRVGTSLPSNINTKQEDINQKITKTLSEIESSSELELTYMYEGNWAGRKYFLS